MDLRGITPPVPSAPPSEDLLQEAFTLLRELIIQFDAQHKRPLAATLKAAMVARTYGGFDERRLGFSSFKRFLWEAQGRGLITISSTALAGELMVTLTSATASLSATTPGRDLATTARIADSTVEPSAPTSGPPPPATIAAIGDYGRSPIPNDLWRCFVDWNPGLKRCFHKPSSMALSFPERPIPMERPEHTAARDKWRQAPDLCVDIPAIPMSQQIEWMRGFTEEVTDSASRRLLEAALAADRPNSNFSLALRANTALWMQWRTFRIQKVREIVEAWAESNQIEMRLEDAAVPAAKAKPSKIPAEGTAERALRNKVLAAVERMSIGDLRRLPIPIEYLEDL